MLPADADTADVGASLCHGGRRTSRKSALTRARDRETSSCGRDWCSWRQGPFQQLRRCRGRLSGPDAALGVLLIRDARWTGTSTDVRYSSWIILCVADNLASSSAGSTREQSAKITVYIHNTRHQTSGCRSREAAHEKRRHRQLSSR
jgi:hypothetical protein